MKKFKKVLLSILSLALVAILSIGGTIAYLKSEDSDVNVMTMGNVKIEQIEQEWNDNGELVKFTQLKPLYPYVGTLGWTNKEFANGAYREFTMENVVDKYVSVKNIGKSDAYVRTIIALEMGSLTAEEFEQIGISINKIDGAEFDFAGTWEWSGDFVASIDGKNYYIMVATHESALSSGETTIPSLLQVYMSKDSTNEDVEKIDGNENGRYDILVKSQAVQTNGFDDAKTALNTAFGESTGAKVQEWFTGMSYEKSVASFDELTNALTKYPEVNITSNIDTDGEAIFMMNTETVINGNGNTIEADDGGYGYAVWEDSNVVFNDINTIGGGVNVQNSKATFNNGLIEINTAQTAQRYAFYIYNSEVTINDGTFKFEEYRKRGYVSAGTNSTVIINGGTFGKASNHPTDPTAPITVDATSKVIINGGTFGFNPTEWVAAGHTVVDNGNGTWTVQ